MKYNLTNEEIAAVRELGKVLREQGKSPPQVDELMEAARQELQRAILAVAWDSALKTYKWLLTDHGRELLAAQDAKKAT